MRMLVPSLASLRGLGIQCRLEMWCRSQMQLGSCVALAVVEAGSYSSDLTPRLGTSISCRCGPKKEKNKYLNGHGGGLNGGTQNVYPHPNYQTLLM